VVIDLAIRATDHQIDQPIPRSTDHPIDHKITTSQAQ